MRNTSVMVDICLCLCTGLLLEIQGNKWVNPKKKGVFMHWYFSASYPCLLMYECGYISTAFHKKNPCKVNIYAHCAPYGQHLCFRFNASFQALSSLHSNDLVFYPDLRFGWRPPSSQHADQHTQLPPQPPADTKPHHASIRSHGYRTE